MAGYWRHLTTVVGILCLLLVLPGQNGQGSQTPSKDRPATSGFQLPQNPKSAFTQAEQKGQALYAYYCAICHGKTGNGDGFNSYNLTTPPRNFTDSAKMASLSDKQIEKAIRGGGVALGLSPQMPAWGGVLSQKQAADLTVFIRTFAQHDNPGK